MNKLPAHITELTQTEDIILITLDYFGFCLKALIINNQEEYITKGNKVYIVFKETNVLLAKNLSGTLSFDNSLPAKITNINTGKILTEIKLDLKGEKISTITNHNGHFQINDEVQIILNPSGIFIMKYD